MVPAVPQLRRPTVPALVPTTSAASSRGSDDVPGPDPAPYAGQAHPVAPRVAEDDRQQRAGAHEDEVGVPPEQGRVGELEKGVEQGVGFWDLGVREGEFVEVVHVGDAEVERGYEDGLLGREVGEQAQGREEGAEEELLCYWALILLVSAEREYGRGYSHSNEVPPADIAP